MACPGPGETEGWHVHDLERGGVGMSRTWREGGLACPGPGEKEGWNVQDLERGRIGMFRTWREGGLACPGPGLPTLCIVVFFVFSEFS